MRTMVHHLIEQQAARARGRRGADVQGRDAHYRGLWDAVQAVAKGLVALGLRREERVAVYLDKRIETVTAIFGTSLGGGVFVPINPLLRPKQVGYILADCDVRVLVTSTDRLATLDR